MPYSCAHLDPTLSDDYPGRGANLIQVLAGYIKHELTNSCVCVCKALEIDATRINLQTGEKMSSVNSSCLINYLPFFCAFLINFWYSASHCLNPKFYLFINIIHQSFCQTILNNNSIYVRLRLSSFAKCFDRLAKPNPEFQQKAGN